MCSLRLWYPITHMFLVFPLSPLPCVFSSLIYSLPYTPCVFDIQFPICYGQNCDYTGHGGHLGGHLGFLGNLQGDSSTPSWFLIRTIISIKNAIKWFPQNFEGYPGLATGLCSLPCVFDIPFPICSLCIGIPTPLCFLRLWHLIPITSAQLLLLGGSGVCFDVPCPVCYNFEMYDSIWCLRLWYLHGYVFLFP